MEEIRITCHDFVCDFNHKGGPGLDDDSIPDFRDGFIGLDEMENSFQKMDGLI